MYSCPNVLYDVLLLPDWLQLSVISHTHTSTPATAPFIFHTSTTLISHYYNAWKKDFTNLSLLDFDFFVLFGT